MPMGAKNCPAVFQRLMDNAFRTIPRSRLVIYLDDILAHSATEEENIQNFKEICQILRDNNLKLRADKTKLLMSEIDFCGFVIKNGKKMPNPKKVEAIKQIKRPRNKNEAQSLFGLLNYHRNFIPNFATKAVEITKSYRGDFNWTPNAELGLTTLKNEIAQTALELTIPNVNNAEFILETDASQNGYGAVLFICTNKEMHAHHGPKCLRPIEYASKMFTPAQMKYQVMEKELFAGKEAR
jgi:hypothetical protein